MCECNQSAFYTFMNYQRANLINAQIILLSSPCVTELELNIDTRNVTMDSFIHSESIY